MRPALPWLAAIALAYAIAASGNLDDNGAEWAQADALREAQDQAARDLRVELAAARMCREAAPGSAMVRTGAGEFVCVPRKVR